MAAGLRILVVVNHAGLHLEEQHHRVILVNSVVAVHGPISLKVAEPEEDGGILIKLKPRDILARYFYVRNAGARGADATTTATEIAVAAIAIPVTAGAVVMPTAVNPTQDLVLFQMNMDGVLPIVPWIN